MNPHLQHILDTLLQIEAISDEQRSSLNKSLKDADKELTILEFKLDRTEKIKRTTAILLEETIEELEHKRQAIEESNSALQRSLEDLKSTQAQLIQSEKMASLGELTAGIAHEIQNPLNFVNNFSEVSTELLEEIQDIRRKTQEGKPESEEDEILKDIKHNLEKITLHGKRADAIVKGMLEHSKRGSGQKEPTNLNALAEEFARLAYNSFLAKNKDFKGKYKLKLDPELPLLEVVPQDIGKVLLNLLNNAFYACDEQRKDLSGFENLTGLTPTVTVSTKTLADKIEISISDNGPGIPDPILDKIFQPFFTTKPTGQGTGLGLSLSYDIVRAHGGEIHVESKAGEFTAFEISLPM
jgi:two-component system, NtrC family, sensor kinase